MPTNINSKVLLRCLSQIQAPSYCEIIAVVGRPALSPHEFNATSCPSDDGSDDLGLSAGPECGNKF